MKNEIEIPEGCEAKIEGNKVVFVPKESEDERIRKEIVDFIFWSLDRGNITDGQRERSDAWLAYLEKQKEQKPTSKYKIGDTIYFNSFGKIVSMVVADIIDTGDGNPMYEDANGNYVFENDISWFEKQKEYIEDIRQYAYNKGVVDAEENHKPVNMDEDVELGLDRALQIIKDAKRQLRGYQSDDGIYECDHAIQTLERILKNGIEQKPAEYEKPLLSKFERAVYDCVWDKVTCKPEGETQEEYAKRWAGHLLLMVRDWADDYIDTQIESAKRKAYDKGKADAKNPAEWSKEDRRNLDDAISVIEHLKNDCDWGYVGVGNDIDNVIDFLKSLRPRPKQEWSDEDHDYYGTIIAKLEVTQNDAMLTDQQMSFLKSIPERFNIQPKQGWNEGTRKALDEISDYLKYRGMEDESDFIRYLLRPQPHWKPSDEQMETLKVVIDRALLTCRQQGPLEELYKDLQKLL